MGQSGPVVAALEHDRGTLEDPQLRQAVLAVGRLAVRRLMRASEAAQQSVDLAESRRRLVQAEGMARQQFADDVTDGPGRSLARCLAVLDEAVTATPPGLRADLAAARAAGLAAREELARVAAGDADRMLARAGLAAALVDLAGSAGAEASVHIGGDIGGDIAVVAWFAASEALTNALKHAGPARIWLSAVTERPVCACRWPTTALAAPIRPAAGCAGWPSASPSTAVGCTCSAGSVAAPLWWPRSRWGDSGGARGIAGQWRVVLRTDMDPAWKVSVT